MISVIVPAYNAEMYIEDCLNSILNQTYGDFEIIVVNDGSADKTLDIINRLAQKNDCIKIIDKSNGGVSAAKNDALGIALGEYVTFVDSDDTIPETALSDLISLMRDDTDFVSGNYNEIKFEPKPHSLSPAEFKNFEEGKKSFVKLDSYLWWQAGRLYRREIIDKYKLRFDTTLTFGEDHIFNLSYARHCDKKLVFTDKVVYNYFFIRNGLTAKYYPDMHKIQRTIIDKAGELFGGVDRLPDDFMREYISRNLSYLTEYYIIGESKKNAFVKIEEIFEKVYKDLINDDILNACFNQKLTALIKSKSYAGFTKEYIKEYPQRTIWRKFKNEVKLLILKIKAPQEKK